MARFQIPLTDGVYIASNPDQVDRDGLFNFHLNHQLNFEIKATTFPTAGQVVVDVKAPSSNTWEAIPDGTVQFSDLSGLLTQYKASDYRFTVSGSDGVGHLTITDTKFRV